jgi:hypothetical protein
MNDHDNNIFDEDDALDYIMSEEVEKDVSQQKLRTGCLGLLTFITLPASLIYFGLSLLQK